MGSHHRQPANRPSLRRSDRNARRRADSVRCLRATFGLLLAAAAGGTAIADDATPFGPVQPLEWKGDLASRMVQGIDRFLLRETDAARQGKHRWRPETSSRDALARSQRAARPELAHLLGVRDHRVPFDDMPLVATFNGPAVIAASDRLTIYHVRWPVAGHVTCEGLLLIPKGSLRADVVAIPDADQSPATIAGLTTADDEPYAWHLANAGCRVVIPTLFSRRVEARRGRAKLTDREFIYRITYPLGRHPIGYEVQSVLAVVDWFQQDDAKERPIGVIGWGEGGQAALFAGALDERIEAVGVGGYFGDRRTMWREPIDRNLFGFLERFGGAEVAAMITPRRLVIDAWAPVPHVSIPPGTGGAPGQLAPISERDAAAEAARARRLAGAQAGAWLTFSPQRPMSDQRAWTPAAVTSFLSALCGEAIEVPEGPERPVPRPGSLPDGDQVRRRQLRELQDESRRLLRESPAVRRAFWSKVSYKSLAEYERSTAPYRRHLAEEVIGRFDRPLLPPHPRMRQLFKRPRFTAHEVVLDVFPDVFAYGILLWPEGIAPGEKRPVVVCQHGLEGRPIETIEGDHRAYHDFAAKLAQEGFIVFAPQNVYLFGDRFRTLQRKANPLKKTLFSVMVPQHEQITRWLAGLPNVDARRIAFYGLSYGGKSAMRIPALVRRYCLSICSADFNEWVWKLVDTHDRYSYVWTGEYEIAEFDLGSTFNYAELAALICPRPFMVERGHFDGVAPDEMVAYEYAKVRHLYAARLNIGERTGIEWFVGPHMINGRGTFAFLRRHLHWQGDDARNRRHARLDSGNGRPHRPRQDDPHPRADRNGH